MKLSMWMIANRLSPLMDVKGYMQELEAAYRAVWRNFCENGS